MLDGILNSLDLKLSAFVFLDLDQEEALTRISSRAAASEIKRSDDTDKSAVSNRFSVFAKESISLSKYYEDRNLLNKINGGKSIDTIHLELVKLLEL